MGAKTAPAKSVTFASNVKTRKWLRNHRWRRQRKKAPLQTDMRDLGGHLNTAENRTYGTTLTVRMRKTAESVRALQRKRAPYKAKAELIRSKQLPKALYGCETAPVNESALKKLQTKIVDTLTFTTTRRSADLTFAVAARGMEVDPDIAIFKNRVLGMRRARVVCEENKG